jgi:hypothetical protein
MYYEDDNTLLQKIGVVFVLLLIAGFVFALFFVRFQLSNQIVSGIVYNTTNDRFISNATCFSVRAGENTPVTDENQSSYCLPPNSEYKEIVNKASLAVERVVEELENEEQ